LRERQQLNGKLKTFAFCERKVFYGCSAFHRRGRAVCSNALTVPMDVADHAVLSVLEANLLYPRVLEAAVRRATKRLSGRAGSLSLSNLQRDLMAVERELANLTAAVAAGRCPPPAPNP